MRLIMSRVPGGTGQTGPSRRRTAAATAVMVVTAGLAGGLVAAPAGAGTAPGCVADGTFEIVVDVAETAPTGQPVALRLTAVDSCGAVVTDLQQTLTVTADNVDGGDSGAVVVEMTAEDAGVVDAVVTPASDGLVFVAVRDAAQVELLGVGTLVAYGPQRYPVVDGLEVLGSGGAYTVRGFTADVDAPAAPVGVSLRIDGQQVVREDADLVSDDWVLAPDSFGSAHGFDLSVQVPPGQHSVCLFVDDRTGGTASVVPVNVRCDVVTGAAADQPAFGWFDGVYRVPAGLRASGWAVDPSRPDQTARVTARSFLVDRAAPRPPTQVGTESVEAGVFRADVGAAYPAYGGFHGFALAPVTGGGDGTGLRVCVDAGPSLDLGCTEATLRLSPQGALDDVQAVPGGVRVRGWALDQDTYLSAQVHVYVDGRGTAILAADGYRADVAAAFPASPGGTVPGYGGYRGFDTTLSLPAGRHSVCTYADDVENPSPRLSGGNTTTLGCRTVVVAPSSPIGRVDAAVPAPGGFAVRGWTADPDAPTTPLQVHTYRDGVGVGITTASTSRPDLAQLEGGRYGTAHGFTTGTVLTGPTARVCTYAVNVGAGQNTTLACQDLSRSLAPTGSLDGAGRSGPGAATTATVRGWAFDPDTAAPVDVHVYVDGRLAGITTASGDRPDVGAAFPGWGAGHGYTLDVRAAPGAQVCTYAINAAQGSTNTTLGCRTA